MSDTHRLLRFGVFELNLGTEELRKSGTIIRLQPQPFQLLAFLASRAGQIVTREEIQERLWSDESELDFERRINQCIKQIRAALADNANQPVYIETLRSHGYRFIAPVISKTVSAPPPRVTVSDSSGLERDIAARVIARITESPSQINRIVDVVKARTGAHATATAIPVATHVQAQPVARPQAQKNQKLWLYVAIAAAVAMAALAAFVYAHH